MQIKNEFNFKLSLRFEIFYGLQTMIDSDSKIHKSWRRESLSSLPKNFFNKYYPLSSAPSIWPIIADTLSVKPIDLSFEQLIEEFKKLDLKSMQQEILLGAIHYPEVVKKAMIEKDLGLALSKVPKKKQEWLAFIGLYPYQVDAPISESLNLLLKSPEKFRKQCIQILESFWDSSFESTWRRLKLPMQKSLYEKEHLFHSCSLSEFAKTSLLKIDFDSAKRQIKAIRGGATIPYEEVGRSYIFPSVFNDKRYWTAFDVEDKSYLYIPYFDPTIVLEASDIQTIDEIKNADLDPSFIFKALGDTTRYAMIKLLAKESRSSLELARALKVSKPTISHHLHILREAELVNENPERGSIILSLKRFTFERISDLVVAELFNLKNLKPIRRTK